MRRQEIEAETGSISHTLLVQALVQISGVWVETQTLLPDQNLNPEYAMSMIASIFPELRFDRFLVH